MKRSHLGRAGSIETASRALILYNEIISIREYLENRPGIYCGAAIENGAGWYISREEDPHTAVEELAFEENPGLGIQVQVLFMEKFGDGQEPDT